MKRGTRILVVEDDHAIARLLQLELEHRGLVVHVVGNGPSALPAVETFRPDAMVLDILLPGYDGERVLRAIRNDGHRLPVIMLTARDATHDKIRALDAGADDYLTKPFAIEELLSRLRAILRRVDDDASLRVAGLEIDSAARRATRGDEALALTAREFDLLELLARNARRVIPRDVILERVWGHAPDVDANVVDVYIGYLRKKLDADGAPRLIHTVRGVGYVLRPDGG